MKRPTQSLLLFASLWTVAVSPLRAQIVNDGATNTVSNITNTFTATPGAGTWAFSSDRNLKENFKAVEGTEVLRKVCDLPITEWNYRGYPQRHVGPMAQDFHAQFPLNDEGTMLNSADLHGLTLAAIQGLNQKLSEELKRRDEENAELKTRLERLEELLSQTDPH